MTKQLEQLTPDTPATLQYTPEFQTTPLTIRGDREVVVAVDEQLTALEADLLKHQPVTPVEPPKTAPKPELAYINLASLSDREIARMSLSAFKYDILTFGRNQEYRRFTAAVKAEKDLAMDMQLGLVQQVHCRLHERLLNGKR